MCLRCSVLLKMIGLEQLRRALNMLHSDSSVVAFPFDTAENELAGAQHLTRIHFCEFIGLVMNIVGSNILAIVAMLTQVWKSQ